MKFQLVKVSTHQSMVPGAEQETWVMSAVPEKTDLAEFGHMLAPKALLPGKFYTTRMTRWLAGIYPEDAEWVSYWMKLTDSIESMQRLDRMTHNSEGYVRPKFITGVPASVKEISANLAGNTTEGQEETASNTGETPVEACGTELPERPGEPGEGLVPDTMAGIWKLLGFTAESFYDLGIHTLSPAGKKPSLEASLKAYRRNMLLTVARALLLKEYDRKFTAEQVRKSAIAAWKNNGRMKKYGEVIRENLGDATAKSIVKILDEIPKFIGGKVNIDAKYMIPYLGQLWCLKGFILWCKTTRNLTLKKTGWRTAKKD